MSIEKILEIIIASQGIFEDKFNGDEDLLKDSDMWIDDLLDYSEFSVIDFYDEYKGGDLTLEVEKIYREHKLEIDEYIRKI
jgi:hypothetical protein